MKLLFSKHYAINPENIEFVDIPIENEDLLAFICPFLIENNSDINVVLKIRNRLKNFLSELNTTYIKTNDLINGIKFLSHLHEPNEYHLGFSNRNKGKAVSDFKAEQIFHFLRNNKFARQSLSITNEAHNVLLLVHGIGQDIMSDIIANVCRDIFADFTKNICNKYSLPTENIEIEYYNDISKKWERKKVKLPIYNEHIILVPAKLLSGGRAYSNLYNRYVSSNHISKKILKQKNPPFGTVRLMKNGTKKAIIKEIYKQFKKPKKELIDFVLEYPKSLDEFIKYAKENYPALKIDQIKEY